MEGVIERNVERMASERVDLLIVGGGIYGVALALEAARRGLRPLLLERDDFGGATSWNSLRIVHGGIRYLQMLDLVRFRESVGERSWFLRNFPEQVEPLPCVMPLYGDGARRPAILRIALLINDLLSRGRNTGLRADRCLPRGAVMTTAETVAAFPDVRSDGLRGGALWYDAVMLDSQRLLIEMLRWACATGGRALNYVEATELLIEDGRVAGLRATDRADDTTWEFRAPIVINSAGPWSRELARRFDCDIPELFRPMLSFNVLLNRKPLSQFALAVADRSPGAQTYFLHPWKDRIFAGTYEAPWKGSVEEGPPGEALVADFLARLNAAAPGLDLKLEEVLRLHWGLLPAAAEGTAKLAVRPQWVDHGARGGPYGLYSISGVKFTTARLVAERSLRALFKSRGESLPPHSEIKRPAPRRVLAAEEFERLLHRDRSRAQADLVQLAKEEAVIHADDILLRRTDWGIEPGPGPATAEAVRALVDVSN